MAGRMTCLTFSSGSSVRNVQPPTGRSPHADARKRIRSTPAMNVGNEIMRKLATVLPVSRILPGRLAP